ncbi:class I SAM-dependent methyltransferase [Myxococcota bacterium]|nr:class I SAM-dependent methyltransferase [Myxococcota bacterium]
MKLYAELADWYPLLTPLQDYVEESADYIAALRGALGDAPFRLLELGAGAGHNAHYLAPLTRELALVDLSPEMLKLCAETCPSASLHLGDMRTVRLGREFDAVFIHDAICYMLSEDDLRATFETARAHLRPGGVLLIAPDYVTETFEPTEEVGGNDGEGRALRYLGWVWQRPDEPNCYVVDYVIATRVGDATPVVHQDRHIEGVFPRETWRRLLHAVGFTLEALPRANPDDDRPLDLFLARLVG